MNMTRRGFLGGILALGAAPAIVRADSLMRVIARDTGIIDIGVGAYDVAPIPPYGNRLLTIEEITRQALKILDEQMSFTDRITTEFLGANKSIRILRPVRFS